MQTRIKICGATNTARSLLKDQKTYESEYTQMLSAIQDIREEAWYLAIKYRHDPFMSRVHEQYLTMLNNLLKECE